MGTLSMSFVKGLFARRLTAISFLTLKNAEKIICLKIPSKFIGLAWGITNSQKLEKKIHACPKTYVEFFFTTKKKIKREKIFQTCTMNIRGIFFSRLLFFFLQKKIPWMFIGHARNFTLHCKKGHNLL